MKCVVCQSREPKWLWHIGMCTGCRRAFSKKAGSFEDLSHAELIAWVAKRARRYERERLIRFVRDVEALTDLARRYKREAEEARTKADEGERDRILGARVREIARQHDPRLYLYGFVREVMRAMEEIDKEARDAD